MQQPHPAPIYQNSTLLNSTQSQYSHLLYLIQIHPSFQAKVNSFLMLLPNQQITYDGLVKMVSLIYAFLLPEVPKNLQRKLAVQLVNSLQVSVEGVTYSNLVEALLKIASDLVENIDVRSAIGILQLIYSRITDTFIQNTRQASHPQKLHPTIKLQLFDSEVIVNETELPQKMHRRASELIYYQQKLQYNEPTDLSPWQIIIRKLKDKPEQIIPLGYVLQLFCFDYISANFQTKPSYKVRGNKNIVVHDKIQFWVALNGNSGNAIRDKIVNQEIYYNCGVIGISHLPEHVNPAPLKVYTLYRLNQVFNRVNYYQKLKEMPQSEGQQAGQNKYFNILSQFYDRDQFNIDELSLTKEKFIIRRKEQALGIQGKETVKKQPKDYEDQTRILPERIAKAKFQNLVQKRLQDNIKDLTKNLRVAMEQDKNINVFIQKYLSSQDLPKDSSNPFKTDIIQLSKKDPLQILIIGRAKSGKTTLSKQIAKEYNLVHISLQTIVNKLLQRSTFFKQNPPEADEDGNIKGGLLKIEECILEDLENGKKIENEDSLDLINVQLKKEATQAKGYILDLPFEYSTFWYQAVIGNKIYVPKVGCRFFNRIIEIDQSQQQWAHFSKGLMIKPEDLTITSSLDRYFRSKPKPPVQQGQQQPPAEQEEKPAALVQSNLLKQTWQNSALPLIQHLTNHINPLHYIKLKNSYQNLQQLLNYLSTYLYKIPQAKKIEGNQKELLTVGLDQAKIARKWSPWGIVDSVELHKGKILNGKFQFAAQYGGRVFVFENQNNLNLFLQSPRRYLRKLPELPKKTNIAIAGPRKSGKRTIAKLLSQIYGLKIIDFDQILKNVLNKQKQQETHIPSNPDKTSKGVHLSQAQFKQFTKGGVLNAKDVLPIILYQLGIPLQKKPVGWGVEKNQEQGGAAQEIPQQKKAPPKKAKKKEKNQDQRPKTPPLEDLSLKQIIPVINHKNKLDEIRGYILIGYPHNEDQLNSLKAFNIPIDKYILLSDNTQQNPYKTLSKRLTDAEMEQVANFMTAIGPVKQALGQQVFKEITNLQLTPEEIVNKVRQFIDPFYPKTDEDNLNRVCADKQEDGDPIPMGFCGGFCPVTLNNMWLIKGKEQFEAGFQGRRFKFTGEQQLNAFKQNPTKYINKQNLLIPPRIMFLGMRGVGLRTQLAKLNQKYKIPILNLKQSLIQQLQNEKNKRKTQRYYNKGFKPPEFNEQGQLIEDPQLNEEAADFDRGALEVQIMKKMFNGIGEIFINGNYYDVEEESVATGYVDLLANARKLPEVVFVLRCEEPKWLERNVDKKKIQQQLQQLKAKKKAQKQRQRQQARQAARLIDQNYIQPQQTNEEDPDIPKLDQLISQKQEALKAQREADNAKLDQLTEAFKAWNVDIIEIKCQRQTKHVNDRINFAIKPYVEDRLNRWEQNSMLPIQRHRARDFVNNYIALESRFGQLNPFTLMRPVQSYPLIYNDRVYYLNDEEERDRVMRNPKLLQTNTAVPSDIKIVPSVAVIGLPKTGKTTLADSLAKRLGMIKISIQNIIEEFTVQHRDKKTLDILQSIKKGHPLSNQNAVDLIERRVSMSDCQKCGWVLDGFPINRQQCELLNKRGLLPYNVFALKLTDADIKKRVLNRQLKSPSLKQYDYDWDIEIVNHRISDNRDKLLEVEVYFLTKFNNIKAIDGKISKWGIFEEAKVQIEKKVRNRKDFVRALITHSATAASNLGFNFNCIINNLSDYGIFCPISYKIRRQYVKLCPRHHKNAAYYNKKIYLFATEKQLNDFVANPQGYKNRGPAFYPPQQILQQQITQLAPKAENKGFCMVQLSRKKLTRGCPAFILRYKNKLYATSSASNMKLFIKNPVLFEMVKLQDKLPIQFEKKSDLKKIAKQNDCTAFLQHHLSNILMKSLAQLGYRRPKFPTLGSKESALKFLSISLKANNPNKDDQYRQKYLQKLDRFIKQCTYSQQIRQELDRKAKGPWQHHDQQNLLKLCQEYNKFLTQVNSVDKNKYFSQFIR